MPYIWINIAEGHSPEAKRAMMRNVNAAVEKALEINSAHTHIYVNESNFENLAIAGEQPRKEDIALVTVAMSKGRPPVVLHRLSAVLASTVAEALDIDVGNVHGVLVEQEAHNVSVGGVPLAFPTLPKWLFDQSQ